MEIVLYWVYGRRRGNEMESGRVGRCAIDKNPSGDVRNYQRRGEG